MGLVLIFAGISDLKEYKIRNPVVFFGWITGMFLRVYHGGISGMFMCALNILLTVIVCMPLYHIGGVGAGDIKLLSVVSGFHGMMFAWRVFVVFVVISGVCSICKLIKNNDFENRISKMYFLFRSSPGAALLYYHERKREEEFVIPLAPILAVAYFLVCFAEKVGFWR